MTTTAISVAFHLIILLFISLAIVHGSLRQYKVTEIEFAGPAVYKPRDTSTPPPQVSAVFPEIKLRTTWPEQ